MGHIVYAEDKGDTWSLTVIPPGMAGARFSYKHAAANVADADMMLEVFEMSHTIVTRGISAWEGFIYFCVEVMADTLLQSNSKTTIDKFTTQTDNKLSDLATGLTAHQTKFRPPA